MNTSWKTQRLLVFAWLILSGLGLIGCAAAAFGVANPVTTSAYPPPNTTPPRAAPGPTVTPENFNVIPSPDEKVRAGTYTEILPPDPPRYTVEQSSTPGAGKDAYVIIIHDAETNQEIELGNEGDAVDGDALFDYQSDEYVIWRYLLNTATPSTTRVAGMYAYELATGDETLITRSGNHPEASGPWVIYIVDVGKTDKNIFGLQAHNIVTGEGLRLSESMGQPSGGYRTDSLYAITDGLVAWINYDEALRQKSVKVFDLLTRKDRTLETPNAGTPAFISVSSRFVVWNDEFYRGYDLAQDAAFTIPSLPPGWPGNGYFTVEAEDDHLLWTLKADGDAQADRYFTTPVNRATP